MISIFALLFLVSTALVVGQDTTTTTLAPTVPCGTRSCEIGKKVCLNGECVANEVIDQCQTAGSGMVTSVDKIKECQSTCYGETANVTIEQNGGRCKLGHDHGRGKRHHHDGHHDGHRDRHHHHGNCVNGVCV